MIFPRSVLRPPRREPGAAHVLSDLFALLLIIVTITGATTREPLVAALGATALVVTAISRLWSRLSLEEVGYRREFSSDRIFAGDNVELSIVMENRKKLPVPWVRARDLIPDGLEASPSDNTRKHALGGTELTVTTSLASQERVRSRYALTARSRGYYRLGPARLESGDLFGLYTSRRDDPGGGGALVVYPVPVPLPDFYLPSARPGGDVRSNILLLADPNRPYGAREYRPGDPVKSIDWKATARLDGLHVKTYEPSVSRYAVVVFDASTAERPWDGYSREILEAGVTAAASVAVRATALGYQVGLVTNGVPQSEESRMVIAPAADPGQIAEMLRALAMVGPMTVKSIDEMVAPDGPSPLPFGATVVFVTGMLKQGPAEAITRLSMSGHSVVLVWVGHSDPPSLHKVHVFDGRRIFGIRLPEDRFRRPSHGDDSRSSAEVTRA